MYVDERGAKPIYARYVFETNIPRDVKASDAKNITGYVKFISLLNPKNSSYIYFDHGVQTINGKRVQVGESATVETNEISEPVDFEGFVSEEVVDQTYNQYMIEVDSRLTDCIKRTLRNMSFGEWVLFIATEPESVAGLVLACAIDVYIVNH